MRRSADVVIVGAGIAGVSAAYRLAVKHHVGQVTIVDPRSPLTLTSDKSTECYRNWWPSSQMVGLMNRSIDLLEEAANESGNVFGLNRRGYLFVTGEESRMQQMVEDANRVSALGGGPVRIHPGPVQYPDSPSEGFHGAPEGADVFLGAESVREHFPYLTDRAKGAIHIRRAGWFSAQQLGSWMLDRAREHGAEFVTGEVVEIRRSDGAIAGVTLGDGNEIASPAVVDAGGPMAADVAAMAGVDLPLFSELHLKVAYREHLLTVPRDAPMFIWSDPQRIEWTDEEREGLLEMGREELLGEMPIYCHGRPEGGVDSPYLLALWEYHGRVQQPVWPLPEDSLYPEVVMRGLATMVPGLALYRDRLPASTVDGGYYTKTVENRPLIGPAGPEGFYLAVGFSGFGVMVACGAADLLARHITRSGLPEYAGEFLLSRYDDPGYSETMTETRSGQL